MSDIFKYFQVFIIVREGKWHINVLCREQEGFMALARIVYVYTDCEENYAHRPY
jgi:hypothetical protein